MSSIFNNLINRFKTKKSSKMQANIDEYAFSLEEIDNLEEENHKKIKDLKKNIIGIRENDDSVITNVKNAEENLKKLEEQKQDDKEKAGIDDEEELNEIEKAQIEEYLEEINKNAEIEETKAPSEDDKTNLEKETKLKDNKQNKVKETPESFLNLSEKSMALVMDSWQKIDTPTIDKDIIEGKDILNHNYNITYGDNAARYVHNIRKKYEIVICYLIGFNNEKNGFKNKTIFSDKPDNEWKYLENYIKLLEKIRNFKK